MEVAQPFVLGSMQCNIFHLYVRDMETDAATGEHCVTAVASKRCGLERVQPFFTPVKCVCSPLSWGLEPSEVHRIHSMCGIRSKLWQNRYTGIVHGIDSLFHIIHQTLRAATVSLGSSVLWVGVVLSPREPRWRFARI